MSAPAPQPPKRPIVIVPAVSRRDWIIIIVIAVAVLGFVIFATYHVATTKSRNLISGVIRGHTATGEREMELDVSTRGVKQRTADTGYYLKVFVAEENRTYTVMVERSLWEAKKDGDHIEFLRPPDEQQ